VTLTDAKDTAVMGPATAERVDERDLPVRLTTQTDASAKPDNDITFSQWGTNAVITPPSADMVGTLPETDLVW
jgi:hypothetical protein